MDNELKNRIYKLESASSSLKGIAIVFLIVMLVPYAIAFIMLSGNYNGLTLTYVLASLPVLFLLLLIVLYVLAKVASYNLQIGMAKMLNEIKEGQKAADDKEKVESNNP